MHYYRIKHNGVVSGYQTHSLKLDYDYLEEITEEEYNSAVEELNAKAEAEAEKSEQSYIEQLEAENAALLYQVLTGEEYSDV